MSRYNTTSDLTARNLHETVTNEISPLRLNSSLWGISSIIRPIISPAELKMKVIELGGQRWS